MRMKLDEVESYFQELQENVGFNNDEETFGLVFGLINKIREMDEEMDKLTALNRHYLFFFYEGNITKMMEDFKYLEGGK